MKQGQNSQPSVETPGLIHFQDEWSPSTLPFSLFPSHSPSNLQQQRAKDSQGKLSLDDLLIKPVQRIPRYVLFIKDLLKHTAPSHPDHSPLQQALGELTMLAERVNASERERGRLNLVVCALEL